MRVLPTTWQCRYTSPGGSCAAPRLSRTLLYSKESVQNINLPVLKGERSARCILTAKYVRNAAWQHLPAGAGGRGCSPVSAASVCTRSSWGRERQAAGARSHAWPKPRPFCLPSSSLWRSEGMGNRPNECFTVI